jgi:subtilisin-like proprotein convertase family protein
MVSIRNSLSLPKSIHKSFSFCLFKEFISFRNKILISLIIVIALSGTELFPQSCYHPFVDSVISLVDLQSLSIFEKELTGEVPTVIGGEPYKIISRYWKSEGNRKSGQYVYEKFRSYGLETHYWVYSPTGTNIIAVKPGKKFPNQKIIFCAHYDNIVNGIVPDTTYGADDNASGTSAVLETARILRNYEFDYTIIFAAWDEEELYFFGSGAYADSCFKHRDSIVAVINLDMIGWDGNNDGKARVGKDSNSVYLAYLMQSAMNIYEPSLNPFISASGGSDEVAFQRRGYKGILLIEDTSPDFNPYYHTVGERFFHFNEPYFVSMTKSAIAALLVLQKDYIINIDHTPLQSTTDTAARIVTAVITSNHRIIRSLYGNPLTIPRLYYKIEEGSFVYVNAFDVSQDTFRFIISGQPTGRKMSYYIAAQDSLSTIIGSLPVGARGLEPPGTIPPDKLFSYYILTAQSQCSNTLPKELPTLTIMYDSITIIQAGIVADVDVNLSINHQNDTDICIWLAHESIPLNQLSLLNGGSGENYTNTTFDDEADISIKQGKPPFTGSFRPQQPLSSFDNSQLQGLWRLRVYNNSATETGQLINWCINLQYCDPIGIINNQVPLNCSITQNYPNPFNSSTSISYSLVKQYDVKIIIYDVLGRELRTLINKRLSAGNYVLSFNANDIASGLYFYTMFLDGNQFESKKMVLIK